MGSFSDKILTEIIESIQKEVPQLLKKDKDFGNISRFKDESTKPMGFTRVSNPNITF